MMELLSYFLIWEIFGDFWIRSGELGFCKWSNSTSIERPRLFHFLAALQPTVKNTHKILCKISPPTRKIATRQQPIGIQKQSTLVPYSPHIPKKSSRRLSRTFPNLPRMQKALELEIGANLEHLAPPSGCAFKHSLLSFSNLLELSRTFANPSPLRL